jgi:hypothetical protein
VTNIRMCEIYLIKHRAMKTSGEVEVQLHTFITSAIQGGEWSCSRHSHFIPGLRALGTHWMKGLVGPQSRSGRCGEEEKNSFIFSPGNRTPVIKPVF